MGLHDAPRRCKLRTASIYEANSNFHHISWSPTRFRSSSYPFLGNARYATRGTFYSGVPVFQPTRQKIALQWIELQVFPKGSNIKTRIPRIGYACGTFLLPIALENAALLHLRYHEITNMYDHRYDQQGASKRLWAEQVSMLHDLALHVLFIISH